MGSRELWTALILTFLIVGACLSSASTSAHDITGYQQEILAEFRDSVKELLVKDFMRTDAYLLRWLDVADFDLYEAVTKLNKSLEWRKLKNVDEILGEDYSWMDEAYPVVVDGRDKDGRPVIYAQIGAYDIRKITISGQQLVLQRFSIRLFELFEEYMHYFRQTTDHHNVTQITAVYDVAGWNLKQGGCYQCVKMFPETILNFEPNYPGVFHRIYLINTPAIFYSVVRLARNFLSEENQKVIRLFDYDRDKWTAALLEQIPADQLATKYGGRRVVEFGKSTLVVNRTLFAAIMGRATENSSASNWEEETTASYNGYNRPHTMPQELTSSLQLQLHKRHGHHHYHYHTASSGATLESESSDLIVKSMGMFFFSFIAIQLINC